MERIADHLGDGWVVGDLTVESGAVGAVARYEHASGRHVRWTVDRDGQRVALLGPGGSRRTWLETTDVRTGPAVDAIQDCAWFVEQGSTSPAALASRPAFDGDRTGRTDDERCRDRSVPTPTHGRTRVPATASRRRDEDSTLQIAHTVDDEFK
jgi:hypothetical protein